MAIINVPGNSQARSIHVQQIINWLRGIPSYSEAVSFTGITSASAYALATSNHGVGGLSFVARDSAGTIPLLDVKDAGVVVRPHDNSAVIFRVRNFANDTDLFAVDASGVTFAGGIAVTTTGVQVLTNKSLTTPNLSGPVISDYADFANQGSAPAAPGAGILRLYETGNAITIKNSANLIKTMATIEGTETLLAKTLTTPTLTNIPVISSAFDIAQVSAPAAPGAGVTRLYAQKVSTDEFLRYVTSTHALKELVDTDTAQTLSNKTISVTTLTAVTLNNPVIPNYEELQYASSPGGGTSALRLWSKNDNNLYFTTPAGSIASILTSINTPTVTGLSYTRSLIAVGL